MKEFNSLIKKSAVIRIVVLLTLSGLSGYAFADGTKQVSPTNSADGAALFIDPTSSAGNYHGVHTSAPAQRLQFTILNNATENLYLGFHPRTFSNGATTLVTNAYYRILDAAGAVVSGPTAIPTTGNGFISTWAQANAGPNIGGATPAGYTPFLFDPTANGAYSIEIYRSNDLGITPVTTNQANASLTLPFFDFTVSTTANVQSPGRIWNRKWSFITCDITNAGFPDVLTSSFTGDFYTYTPDGFVLRAQFGTGFRPLAYQLAMNFTGPAATGTFTTDRKSINAVTSPALSNGYPVFLTSPDATAFPNGSPGSPAITSGIYGCPGAYFIPYYLDQAGDVAILLDLNGTSGYQAGTSDRVLEAYGLSAGSQVMAWDGLNGLGAAVPSNLNIAVTVTLFQGRTNIPMQDAELNSNGISVSSVFPALGNRKLYWDDASLTNVGACANNNENNTGAGVAVTNLLSGVSGSAHSWDGPNPTAAAGTAPTNGGGSSTITSLCDDFGNVRCLNTWFYAADYSTPVTNMLVPNCDLDGDGIANNVDLDDDNDGIPDLVECPSDPLLDADGDGIPNYIDPDFAGFTDINSDGVDDRFDFDLDGVINSFDLDADGDGITDIIESGQTDANSDGRIDGFADLNSNGISDPVDANCTGVNGQITATAGTTGTVTNTANAVDASATTFAQVNQATGSIDLDMGALRPAGTIVTISLSSVNAGAATGTITRSTDDATYNGSQAYSVTTTTAQNITYQLGAAARYIRVSATGGSNTRVYIASYSNCNGVAGTQVVPVNTDGTGKANYLDIDSDDDGITDNSEAQSTTGYTTPSGSDTDKDGIDNAYDNSASFGGNGLTPVNTDGTDNPDYTDLNSDNDAYNDALEGWDTDGNGVANILPSGSDSDGDGLDNAYDTDNTRTNPTNGTTPASYPNVNLPATPERDWREIFTPPAVTITGTTSIAENSPGTVTLTVTLSAPAPASTTVNLGYTGTATSGTDYVAGVASVTIPAGSLTASVIIDPNDDLIYEGNETVIVTITSVSGGAGATIGTPNNATVTITDNEAVPSVSLSGTASVAENAGTGVTLTATLSGPASTATTVTLTYTATATNGTDYTASSTTITIPAGSTTGTVTITPVDDLIYEGNETVIATISAISGGNGSTIGTPNAATVTIVDNETIPSVSISGGTSIAENSPGVVTLTVTLSGAASTATVVNLAYTGTATSGTDYVAGPASVTIPAGSTTVTLAIDPNDDLIYEGNETVITTISSVTGGNGATIGTPSATTVTIVDNETVPSVSISGGASIAENAGTAVTLTATLSGAASTATTVTLTYTGTATNGTDYTTSSTTITIPAGATTGTVTITPVDDLIYEGNETVIATISAISGGNGATIGTPNTATVTIVDNETVPAVTLTGTTSIAENAGTAVTLTATLSSATTAATTVTLAYTGTATGGGTDYTASSTTITIPAGATTGTVTITPVDDLIYEGNETVIATISAVSGGNGATIGTPNAATVTIVDNESVPSVSISGGTSIAENSPGVVTLTVTLSGAASTATVVNLAYTGTATSGTDYVAGPASVTIPAGSTTITLAIDPNDDLIYEGNETVITTISSVTGGNGVTIGTPSATTVTIVDNETVPSVSISGGASIAENAGTAVTLTATLSGPAATATTVTLTYTGTATGGGTDYTASSATITIPAGSTTGTVTITPVDDLIYEGNETVIATISAISGGNGATIGSPNSATVTIVDNETVPSVSITGGASIAENSPGVVTLTVTLSGAASTATVVNLAYTGTATSGTDYVAGPASVTIPAGSTTITLAIDPNDDLIYEGNETVITTISSVTGGNGATIGTPSGTTVTIVDNETVPVVSITGGASILENSGGSVTLTVSLSSATTTATTITLGYSGTATSGTDYTTGPATVTIPAGSASVTLNITPIDDAIFEGTETAIVTVTNVTGGNGATISPTANSTTVNILDNETGTTVSLSGTASIAENSGGSVTLTATLSSSTTQSTTITLAYTGTATNGTDYTASSATITIPAGATTGTVTITPVDDLVYEGNETVIATIASVSGGNGALIGSPTSATVTITDNETIPSVILTGTTSVAENAGTAVTLTATLSGPASAATTVTLTYTGTATGGGVDYTASSATITIPAGATTGTVTITPVNDNITEGNETVITTISAISGGNGATIGTPNNATVTITDDEAAPTVSISGGTTIAENAGTSVTLTATLSNPAATATTITLAYTGTATGGGVDYTASSATITIPAGAITGTVTVTPINDNIAEGTETVIATITAVTGGNGATIGTPNNATVTITDDEAAPTVSISGGASIAENAGTAVTLTATLSGPAATATTVTLAYTGTATGGGVDYTSSSTTITIPAGATTGTVTITPVNDNIAEGNETIITTITAVTGGNGATIGTPASTIVTIVDDEAAPSVTLSGTATIAENAGTSVTLTATLSGPAATATTVTLTYTGTATGGGVDYTASSATITIPAGATTGTVTLTPVNDNITEGNETVIATITAVTGGNGAIIGTPNNATVTITDDEAAPAVSISGGTTVAENAGTSVTLTATLSNPAATVTTVTLAYTGTATSGGVDYTASSATITIPAGATTGTVTVTPVNDNIAEGTETVIATITAVTGGNGATIGTPNSTTVTITDDEAAPTVSISGGTTIAENAPGVVTLTATLSGPAATATATTVTLSYTGTAANGADYAASSTTITIPAGSTTGTVTIDPTDDNIYEGDETVIATITNVTGGNGATIGTPASATVTITDDETAPSVTISGGATIAENSGGSVTLTAALSGPASAATTVTLTYTGTAANATDYTASSVTITIPAGSTTGTVTITPLDDLIYEGTETVIATITSVSGGNGATIGATSAATVTITDNESIPSVSLTGTVTVAENSGAAVALTATLSGPASTAVTVMLSYTGTATNGTDYTASSATITIPAGSTTGTVTVTPVDDLIYEGSETVIVTLTNITGGNGATIGTPNTATVTITDNETVPEVNLSGTATVAENSGTTVTLTATLSGPASSATTVTLSYNGSATYGTDYVASSVTITIPAGATTGTVTVNPTDDLTYEGTETAIVTITAVSGGNGATIGMTNAATVTITDNEAVPAVTLSGTASVAEDAATGVVLTATLSGPASTPTVVTLTYTGTATNGADYTASSATITIPAGAITGTVTITPVDDLVYEGDETVIATITNVAGGNGVTAGTTISATVTIIENDNAIPVANNNTAATNEDTPVTIPGIQLNDTDADGTVVTSTIDLDPAAPGQQTTVTTAQGTWTVNTTTGDVTYVPALNFNGTAVISYTIQDNSGAVSNQATVTVTVNPVNDAPVAVNDTFTSPEDVTAVIPNILSNDTDVDNALSPANIDLDPTTPGVQTTITTPQGTWTVNPSTGSVTFVPVANFNGTASVPYQICDGGTPVQCATADITVTVTPVNDAPVITNEFISVGQNTPFSGDVTTAGDYDIDGTPLTVNTTPVVGPAHGTIVVNTNGTYTYTPNAGYTGSDLVVVSVCDAGLPLPAICVNDTIFVTVLATVPPVANNDVTSTNEDTPVSFNVVTNDTDSDGTVNPATVDLNPGVPGIQSAFTNAQGTWTVNAAGLVTYTPALNFNGTAILSYTVNDNVGASSNVATLTITVNPVNDAPAVDNEYAVIPEDSNASGDFTNAGDSDVDGTALTVNATPVVAPLHGTIVVNADGTYIYTPDANFNGTDLVVVSVCDAGLPLPAICVNDTLFITITPVQDPPSHGNENVITEQDQPLNNINVLANNTDPDGDPLTVTANGTSAQGGTVVVNANGTISYTPPTGYIGMDTIIYTVCDTAAIPNCVQDTLFVNVQELLDTDGDGVPNIYDLDDDNDGIPDTVEIASAANGGDTDGDGIPDYLDLDSDNDGIPDVIEAGGSDPDGDGMIGTGPITDTDGDGLSDLVDPDNGGTPLPLPDFDNDGHPDYVDLDSDNDGIPDITEAGGTDANGDGKVDTFTDANGDGLDDNLAVFNPVDTDGDGNPDYTDLDSDNDGITDIIEAGGTDANHDGVIDSFNDANGDGMDDNDMTFNPADTDGDGVDDYQDLDSDNDGIPDIIENGGTDANHDGMIDGFTDVNGDGFDDNAAAGNTDVVDTDNDGVPDFQDLDSDNDGIPDIIEAGGTDANHDGVIDNFNDANGDGMDDNDTIFDPADTDGDGVDDYVDLDSDNDGIPDLVENGGTDANGDGVIDNFTDVNGDGFDDNAETNNGDVADTDNDGVPDYHDLDSDNDGIPDIIESGGTDANGDGMIDSFNDANGDGMDDNDTHSNPADTDGDGIPDFQDPDSDGDGIPDIIESGGTDTNHDGMVDGFTDANGDGMDDNNTISAPTDTDSDGIPDYQDSDSDNDGVPDIDENDPNHDGSGPDDSDGDGIPDYQDSDDDNDGIPTIVEGTGDCNDNGIPNYLDAEPCPDTNPATGGEVKVPEAFSPNGDGTNDTWVIEGLESFPGNTLMIFNRWGYEVFNVTDYQNNWDGTSNGKINVNGDQLPTGTYYYILDTGTSEFGVIKGYVYLKR